MLSLFDGMGSSREAAAESRKPIELLEQFLEAGVSARRPALWVLINSASVYERRESRSTLDICPWICTAAAVTFLQAGGGTHVSAAGRTGGDRAASAPRRDFSPSGSRNQSFRLGDGDTIVLVTDGALDVFSGQKKEEQFAALLEEQTAANPWELAAALMEQLMERCQGKARMI